MASPQNETLYIIVNSIPPYCYEINQFLACPDFTECEVRFKRKWLQGIPSKKDMENRQGLLILRNWDTGDLIPLRRLKTTTVEEIGEIYAIHWLTQEIINYDQDEKIRNSQISSFNSHLADEFKNFGTINEPSTDFRSLLFFVKSDYSLNISENKALSSKDELDAWGKLINIVGRLEIYSDVDFIKILGIVSSRSGTEVKYQQNNHSEHVFLLNTNAYYKLRIFQQAFTNRERGDNSVSARYIVLKSDDEVVRAIRDKNQITGKYSPLHFHFKTHNLSGPVYSELRLETDRETDPMFLPSIRIPIKVKIAVEKRLLQAFWWVIFSAGSFVLFFYESLFPNNSSLALSFSIFALVLTSGDVIQWTKNGIRKIGLLPL